MFVSTPDIGLPNSLRRNNEIDVLCGIVRDHRVERHLSVPQKTKHEVAASEHHPLSVETDLMLLSLADNRVVRVPVGGIPIRVFLANPVNDSPTILLGVLHKM